MKSLHCLTMQVEGQKGTDLFRLHLVTMKILVLVVALHCIVFFPSTPCASSEKFHTIQSKGNHILISNFSADQTKLFQKQKKKLFCSMYVYGQMSQARSVQEDARMGW